MAEPQQYLIHSGRPSAVDSEASDEQEQSGLPEQQSSIPGVTGPVLATISPASIFRITLGRSTTRARKSPPELTRIYAAPEYYVDETTPLLDKDAEESQESAAAEQTIDLVAGGGHQEDGDRTEEDAQCGEAGHGPVPIAGGCSPSTTGPPLTQAQQSGPEERRRLGELGEVLTEHALTDASESDGSPAEEANSLCQLAQGVQAPAESETDGEGEEGGGEEVDKNVAHPSVVALPVTPPAMDPGPRPDLEQWSAVD